MLVCVRARARRASARRAPCAQPDRPRPLTVFPDGKVCISILHPPGVDAFNTLESADERWRPILGVEQILISVIAMLNDPNIGSPANIDAAIQFRDDPRGYKRKVRELVARTIEE